MTPFLILFAAAVAVATFAGETKLGRMLRRSLIESPAEWLNNAGPIKLIAVMCVALFIACAPEIGLFMAADLTLYFEVLAATMLVAGQLRVRMIVQRTCRLAQNAGRALINGARRIARRAVRAIRTVGRSLRPPANDPDGWALA